MKKFIALLLCTFMLVSLVSCSRNNSGAGDDTTDNKETSKDQTENNESTSSDNNGAEGTDKESDTENDLTVGEALYRDFKNNSSGSCTEIAERLLENEVIAFMGGAVPVEEGYLAGFNDTEIKGFKDGVMFAPMIGTIPFVGYVFELEDDSQVESFKTTLKNSANLRWNICTTADEMICENEGNKVFFLMCPTQFDEAPADEA